MKKLILLVCFLLVSSLSYSQIFTEDFDYTAGEDITANGWTAISAGGTNPIKVSSGGLTFTDYIGSGIGNASSYGPLGGEDDSRDLSSLQTSGIVYGSFMLNVTNAVGAGDYFFALRSSSNSHNARVSGRLATGGYNLGLSNTGATTPVYAPDVFLVGTTYLVVVKYEFVAGTGNDLISMFVFSTALPSVEPSPLIGPSHPAGMTDAADLSSVLLRQGGANAYPAVMVDGIYVDNTWNNNVLPVELASFTSVINKRDVTLNWVTASESNNSGFEIERSASNSSWSKIGHAAGNGTTTSSSSYSFTDRGLATGTYNYRLKQIDFNGNFEYFNLSNEVNVGVPSNYDLSQNYPNPFNPSTSINFDIPTDGNVSIKLFDMSGKEVATLVNEVKTAGYYSVNFNASSLSSGVYFYSITADNFTATKKMMLLK